jgi:hypothetical protein
MRGLALVIAIALPLSGCAMHKPRSAPEPTSYNRRDLPPADGLFTGPDGTWTVYRNHKDTPAKSSGSSQGEP